MQPVYVERLGATPVQVGSLLSAMAAVTTMSLLPAGVLADRLPRKWIMIGGWMLGPISATLIALASSWRGMVPGLLLYAASALCVPLVNVYLARAVQGQCLERTFARAFAGYFASGIISPTIGGWLAQAFGMREVYAIAAILFIASTCVISLVSAQPVPDRGRRRILVRRSTQRAFTGLALTSFLMFIAMYFGFPLAANFLSGEHGVGVFQIGVLGSVQAFGMTVLSLAIGRVGNKHPSWAVVIAQATMWGATLLLLMGHSLALAEIAFFLRGSYAGCRLPVQAMAGALGDENERGLLVGAAETTISLAQATAPYAAGRLYAIQSWWPFAVSLILIPVSMLLTWRQFVVAGEGTPRLSE